MFPRLYLSDILNEHPPLEDNILFLFLISWSAAIDTQYATDDLPLHFWRGIWKLASYKFYRKFRISFLRKS
jgi:hypothetical protein